jgi:site-specific recombinase XerD
MNTKSQSTLRKFELFLRYKNYSEHTINVYLHYLGVFLDSFNKDAYHISACEAEKFLHNYRYTSISMQNQFISSVKLFYKNILNSKLSNVNLERPRKEKKIPRILDKDHVVNSIDKIKNLKHQCILSIGASVGLRVSEVCNLKVEDINSKRMVIIINSGKGRKDRIVPLSNNVLFMLRRYYKEYKPKHYLFEGQSGNKYSCTSCNNIVKKYLGKNCHFHLLRHFTASNLMEQDVSTRKIQSILGHNSERTVTIYTHTTFNSFKNLPLAI